MKRKRESKLEMSSKFGFDKTIKRPNGGQREMSIEDKEEKAWFNSFAVFQNRNEIEEGDVSLVREQVGSLAVLKKSLRQPYLKNAKRV